MAKQGKNREKAKAKQGEPPVEHQFKPGQSGNPNGRPVTKPLTTELKKLLAAKDGEGIKALIEKGYAKAKAGDFRFWKEIMERVDGKVLDQLSLIPPAEDPLPPEDMEAFYKWKSEQAKGKA